MSITRKLLLAARQAYSITNAGPVPPAAAAPGIGWVGAPAGFVSGILNINAGMVGQTDDEIIVAFRGTLPPNSSDKQQMICDWMNDLDCPLVTDAKQPGLVHKGFVTALNLLWQGMESATKQLIAANPAKPVYVTGHSKGGSLANLAAIRIQPMLPQDPSSPTSRTPLVTTFAGAKAGDTAFQQAYDTLIPHSTRFEFQDDIVPHLPPGEKFRTMFGGILPNTVNAGYVSVGDLHFIDWSNNIVAETDLLEFHRFTHLAELCMGFGFATIAADHSIDVGGGYDGAPYP